MYEKAFQVPYITLPTTWLKAKWGGEGERQKTELRIAKHSRLLKATEWHSIGKLLYTKCVKFFYWRNALNYINITTSTRFYHACFPWLFLTSFRLSRPSAPFLRHHCNITYFNWRLNGTRPLRSFRCFFFCNAILAYSRHLARQGECVLSRFPLIALAISSGRVSITLHMGHFRCVIDQPVIVRVNYR